MYAETATDEPSEYGAKQDPELTRCLAVLDKSLAQLDDTAGLLVARLTPVLLPEGQDKDSGESAAVGSITSPMSAELRRMARRVNTIQSALGAAIGRLEL